MEYEELIIKYNRGKKRIFLAVCIFSMIGYVIDYLIFYQKYADFQKYYHILSFLICGFSLVMVGFSQKKSVGFYYNLVSYTAIVNILCSHIFYHLFYEKLSGGAANILSRDIFFMLCYLAFAGFISKRRHIIIQGLIIIFLIIYFQFVFKDAFITQNAPVYILSIIGFSAVMFFFTSVVGVSLQKLSQSNYQLIEANQELVAQSEELETTLNILQDTQNQLVQSEKMASLGVLSAGIAHEINNPLNFIHGGVLAINEYLNQNLKEHQRNLEPYIDAVSTGVKRAADIVTSLNQFSRQGNSVNENCNIHAIIDSCLIILQSQIKFRIEVVKNYSDIPYSFFGNEGKLHQVFLNILSNSCQAIEEKGSVTITTVIDKHEFKIYIRDTGYGIHKENLNKVTDPFFTTKAPGKGVGLGLSIVYSIIEEHHGKIDYKSELGKWTEVSIKLPLKEQ